MKSLALLMIFMSSSALASSPECDGFRTPNDVLKCVVNSNAAVHVGNAAISEANEGIELAAQMPNPQLELEGVGQNGLGYNSEVSLLHTFQLGGKRAARMEVAEKVKRLAENNLFGKRQNLAIQAVSDLYRLRQIEREKEVLGEIIHTFERVAGHYKKVGRLNPEDQMSLSVFQMALEKNRLKMNSLINSEEGIIARIEGGLGRKILLSSNLLPELKREWPELKDHALNGAGIRNAEMNLSLANSQYNLQQSLAWPDLAVGPKVNISNMGGANQGYGVALSVSLPIYQANGGGRSKAMAGIRKNETQANYTRLNLARQRQYYKKVYERVSKGVIAALSGNQFELRHKSVHKMIDRGVVSAPIVVQLHDEIMNYYERLHQQELEGVQAAWTVAALEGYALEKELK